MGAAGGRWSILQSRFALARSPPSLGELGVDPGFVCVEVGFHADAFIAVVDGQRDGFRVRSIPAASRSRAVPKVSKVAAPMEKAGCGIGIPLSPRPKPYRPGR